MSHPPTPPWRTVRLIIFAAAYFGAVAGVGGALAGASIEDRAEGGLALDRRIVAVGDIHGADDGFRAILREAALIDDDDNWVGGDAILVQTGDFLDRGPGAIQVARLLMKLQRQAPESGGDVAVLLGNHEVLNLIGDLRDVAEEVFEDFVDRRSRKRLEASCNRYVAYQRRVAQSNDLDPPPRRQLREQCLAEQRLGEIEYRREIGPRGEVGRWMRGLPSAVRLGGVVFVHGGISPQTAALSLEQLNSEVRREILAFDRASEHLLELGLILPNSSLVAVLTAARNLRQAAVEIPDLVVPPEIPQLLEIDEWQMIRDDGPLWFRGYARWEEEEGRELMPPILEALGAEHVVAGHTPQKGKRIQPRFDSRVFLIDTGMLTSVYEGAPSALELRDGRITALYVDRQTVLLETEGEDDAAGGI